MEWKKVNAILMKIFLTHFPSIRIKVDLSDHHVLWGEACMCERDPYNFSSFLTLLTNCYEIWYEHYAIGGTPTFYF